VGELSLFEREGFERFVLALPAATLVHQWRDDSVAKVGGKIFALYDQDGGEIWLKVSDMAFDLLPELDHIRPAPYFARAKWVAVAPPAPLSAVELAAYLIEAHRLVAARLTRKLRTALDLDRLIAASPHRF
jgi:predicted DNA-binding protein (MmcQ/YjbR family)